MMNSTDLIIGHFEGVLTPAEASQLDELLKTSPEVRAAFEQQRAIEEGMLEDSEALVPPIGLREATLAAALGGALTTTVGGGIAAWLSTKAAVVLSTLALGGVIVGGIVFSDDDGGEENPSVATPEAQVGNAVDRDHISQPEGAATNLTRDERSESEVPADDVTSNPSEASTARPSGNSRESGTGATTSTRDGSQSESEGEENTNMLILDGDGEAPTMQGGTTFQNDKDDSQ